jgi:hypothetical protein
MTWQDSLKADPIPWLLEEDNPTVRQATLRTLLDRRSDDRERQTAQKAALAKGPIREILDQMDDEGWWMKPGGGYSPKYRSGVWSLIMLSQLGASLEMDPRIPIACQYYLDHSVTDLGQICVSKSPAFNIDCLQGNMLTALLDLGFADPKLDRAFEWMARTVTGEGMSKVGDRSSELRYYGYKCGPDFTCGANNKKPCAWGGVKVMLAFSRLPKGKRTPMIQRAIQRGADFFFKVDPSTADYPNGNAENTPSRNWWKFGFPVFYVTDLLQFAEGMTLLGYGKDPRMAKTLEIIRNKQDSQGRWPLEYHYNGKTWVDIDASRKPSKWVTLRAMRVLKAAG